MNSNSPTSELRTISGHSLMWHRWQSQKANPKGTFFLLHGQGDYSVRYQEIADLLGAEGITLTTCDLPGHGLSPGKRGHIPSLKLVRQIVDLALTEARASNPNRPVGFGGHSVGGLLALYLLGEITPTPDFSWISSPLLRPESGQPSWKPLLLRPLSYLLPQVTLSTGVTADMCRKSLREDYPEHLDQFHSRISLYWGRILLEISEVVRTQPERLPSPLPMLITQGEDDQICPPQYCQEQVLRWQRDDLQLKVYPQTRHEPFADECKSEVFADLRKFLTRLIENNRRLISESPANPRETSRDT